MSSEFDKLVKLVNDTQSSTATSPDPRREHKRSMAIQVADSLEGHNLTFLEVIEILSNVIGATIKTAGVKDLSAIVRLTTDIAKTILEVVLESSDETKDPNQS